MGEFDYYIQKAKEEGSKFIEPTMEPEWCENCQAEAEEGGYEYEPEFEPDGDGGWVCANCGSSC